MRDEQFWEDNMDMYWDFFGYWEEYHGFSHMDHHDDEECDLVEIHANCDEFSFIKDQCEIKAEYCRDREYF